MEKQEAKTTVRLQHPKSGTIFSFSSALTVEELMQKDWSQQRTSFVDISGNVWEFGHELMSQMQAQYRAITN